MEPESCRRLLLMFIPATGEPWQQENKLWERGQINEAFPGNGSEFHRDARGERGLPALEHWGSARGVNCPCQADKENNNQEKIFISADSNIFATSYLGMFAFIAVDSLFFWLLRLCWKFCGTDGSLVIFVYVLQDTFLIFFFFFLKWHLLYVGINWSGQ